MIVMPNLITTSRLAAAIAGIAAITGCQSLSDWTFPPLAPPAPREAPAATAPSPAKAAVPESPRIVRLDRAGLKRLQARLARLGFKPGPVDGILGPRTRAAVKRYQSANQLPAKGEISAEFLRHVEAASAVRKAVAPSPVNLDPQDYPVYQPGTTYIYSNGETERVAGANGTVVQWIGNNGKSYTAHRNFLVPRSSWSSDDERATVRISGAADDLWPRRKGAEVSYSAIVMVQRSDVPDLTERRVEAWRCRNDGRQDVSVGIGSFETVVFACSRGPKNAPKLIRTWYYAKSIRHFVRFVEEDPERGETRSVDLVAVRPGAPGWPPIVRAALARAIVHALESEGNEARMPWTSSGVNTSVTIEAKSRFAARDGKPCRRFVQIWSMNGTDRHFPAVACKSGPGKWAIPGLDGNGDESLATSGGVS